MKFWSHELQSLAPKPEKISRDFLIGFVLASLRLHAVLFMFFGFVLALSWASIAPAAWLPIALFLLMVLALSTLVGFVRYKRHQEKRGHPPGWGLLDERAKGQAAAHIGLGFLG